MDLDALLAAQNVELYLDEVLPSQEDGGRSSSSRVAASAEELDVDSLFKRKLKKTEEIKDATNSKMMKKLQMEAKRLGALFEINEDDENVLKAADELGFSVGEVVSRLNIIAWDAGSAEDERILAEMLNEEPRVDKPQSVVEEKKGVRKRKRAASDNPLHSQFAQPEAVPDECITDTLREVQILMMESRKEVEKAFKGEGPSSPDLVAASDSKEGKGAGTSTAAKGAKGRRKSVPVDISPSPAKIKRNSGKITLQYVAKNGKVLKRSFNVHDTDELGKYFDDFTRVTLKTLSTEKSTWSFSFNGDRVKGTDTIASCPAFEDCDISTGIAIDVEGR